jgi:hypothetical protein
VTQALGSTWIRLLKKHARFVLDEDISGLQKDYNSSDVFCIVTQSLQSSSSSSSSSTLIA